MKTHQSLIPTESVHVLNETLGHYVVDTGSGFALFNQFGYAGLYATLAEALQANCTMGTEPK